MNFGDLNSGPVDFARMVTAAFATAYGDDWYVIPVRVPVGTLAQIASLTVRDSFGEVTTVQPVAVQDGTDRPWRFFEMKGDGNQTALFMPSVALGKIEGQPVETVTLIRDETENIAWGIENVYEGATEHRINRLEQWAISSHDQSAESSESDAGVWKYRLLTQIPPHWIPFVPTRIDNNSAQVSLQRGRMKEWELLSAENVGVRGQILLPDPTSPLLIHEEEVPTSGVQVTRAYQYARDASTGQGYVWLGNRKRIASPKTPLARDTDTVEIGEEPVR